MNAYPNLTKKLKKLRNNDFIFFVLIYLFCILGVFIDVDSFIAQRIKQQEVLNLNITLQQVSLYPILENNSDFSISALSAVVMDPVSQKIIFKKNSNLRFATASTAKIMTAITAMDYFNSNDLLEIKTATSEGSIIGLSMGQKVSFLNLLYGMLVPSGNDAALAIAQNYKGGEKAFVTKMNENAKKWNLYNTHFADPAGLLDFENYTTQVDLARLASIAMQNPLFRQIVSTQYVTISTSDFKNSWILKSTNKLLGFYNVNGVKTGFTYEAGEVLVSSVKKNDKDFIAIVMKSQDRFSDTKKLIFNIIDNVNFLKIDPE